jgi:hypothetical protein
MPSARKYPRVSKHYKLVGSQSSFDFVDVRILGDTPLFIDPASISRIDSPWTNACTSTIQSFFQRVLDAIIQGNDDEARRLLGQLGEENATRLGYSSSSRGSGLGDGLADAFFTELSSSKAVRTGLIKDIEDTALLIEGVREDRISDVTTNIIRRHLVEYTQYAARFYAIPLQKQVSIGPFWDPVKGDWETQQFDLPIPTKGGPLLLVPKSIVRRLLACDPGTYYRQFVLPFLQQKELAANSSLVEILKTGRRRVTKKSVEEKYRQIHGAGPHHPGVEKRINLDATNQNPGLIQTFKEKQKVALGPTPVQDIADATGTDLPDFDALLAQLQACKLGTTDATKYERAVEALLNALFYPDLVNPIRQEKIHYGRKRIDISYTNAAQSGFFRWVGDHYPAANIAVECKNYSRPIANPEYDQIAGRFSPSRGKVGLLVYREYEDKDKVVDSCRDTALDDRGFIIALDDSDLSKLVEEAKDGDAAELTGLLRDRFRSLTS